MKKLVIFDLDGTLTDSLKSIQYSTNLTIQEFGYAPIPLEPFRYFVGDGAGELIKRALRFSGDKELVHYEKAMERYRQVFKEHCMYEVKPYDGILELLGALKEQGIFLAVNSNKPHERTVDVIEQIFGKDCFHMLAGQVPERKRKPDPAGIFHITHSMGINIADVIYIGDTCTDMQTGKNAGVFTVGALWGFRDRKELEENKADVIIEKPMELMKYLK
ncbi:MAG: HAD family hydrolase [Roseburia sp.]|nr:HAD family hydrolase [Roseburia sp.]MCM1277928.1 HAD family hydrolase [Robinsoniella sp.]